LQTIASLAKLMMAMVVLEAQQDPHEVCASSDGRLDGCGEAIAVRPRCNDHPQA
jgi:hypothetical protein